MGKLEIRPITFQRWHGKEGEESFARPIKIQALVDPETNRYATGLTEADISKLKADGCPYELNDIFNKEEPHPFWDSNLPTVKLENATMFINSDRGFIDYIKAKIILASKYVANSEKEYEEGKFPEATHVIFDNEANTKLKAKLSTVKRDAVIKTHSIGKDTKRQIILVVLGLLCGDKSDNWIQVKLDEAIEYDAEKVLYLVNKEDKELTTEALIKEALMKSVLKKSGHKIQYGDSILGVSEASVADYLMKDENQELLIRIKEQVK